MAGNSRNVSAQLFAKTSSKPDLRVPINSSVVGALANTLLSPLAPPSNCVNTLLDRNSSSENDCSSVAANSDGVHRRHRTVSESGKIAQAGGRGADSVWS